MPAETVVAAGALPVVPASDDEGVVAVVPLGACVTVVPVLVSVPVLPDAGVVAVVPPVLPVVPPPVLPPAELPVPLESVTVVPLVDPPDGALVGANTLTTRDA